MMLLWRHVYVLLNMFILICWIYTKKWSWWVTNKCLLCISIYQTVFHVLVTVLHSHQQSNYFTFSLNLGIISFWYNFLEMVQWLHLRWLDFNLYFSVVSEIKHLFICWLVIWIPSAVMSIHIVSLVFYGVFYFVNLYIY